MRISSKGRYGLAAMIYIAKKNVSGQYITIISIAEELSISKIYLEQVFSLLRRANLVISVKGSQGGYALSKPAEKISVRDILEAIELSIFENADKTVSESSPDIENAMTELIWEKLDNEVAITLASISLKDLVDKANQFTEESANMFYI